MLSDACVDFAQEFERAAQRLAEAVHHYSSPGFSDTYGEEIVALRRACVRVQKDSEDLDARVELLRLTAVVMRFHDTLKTDEKVQREGEMRALVKLLRENNLAGDLGDIERLVADLRRENAEGEKAASRLRTALTKLGKSTYDVAVKIVANIGSSIVKRTLGL